MGWWTQSETGESFGTRDDAEKQPLLWGDGPADIVDTAIRAIAAEFINEHGRLPSRAEVMAGLTFATGVLELPDRPENCPDVSIEDQQVVVDNLYAAVHHQEPGARRVPQWRIDAEKALGEVIDRLTEPYRSH